MGRRTIFHIFNRKGPIMSQMAPGINVPYMGRGYKWVNEEISYFLLLLQHFALQEAFYGKTKKNRHLFHPLVPRIFPKIGVKICKNIEIVDPLKYIKITLWMCNKNQTIANFMLNLKQGGQFFISSTEKALLCHKWHLV